MAKTTIIGNENIKHNLNMYTFEYKSIITKYHGYILKWRRQSKLRFWTWQRNENFSGGGCGSTNAWNVKTIQAYVTGHIHSTHTLMEQASVTWTSWKRYNRLSEKR